MEVFTVAIPLPNKSLFEDRTTYGLYQLNDEVCEWLYENVGHKSQSLKHLMAKTDISWFSNPSVYNIPEEHEYYNFFFNRKEDALLFKLTWAGK
jgi:hypothetical protein